MNRRNNWFSARCESVANQIQPIRSQFIIRDNRHDKKPKGSEREREREKTEVREWEVHTKLLFWCSAKQCKQRSHVAWNVSMKTQLGVAIEWLSLLSNDNLHRQLVSLWSHCIHWRIPVKYMVLYVCCVCVWTGVCISPASVQTNRETNRTDGWSSSSWTKFLLLLLPRRFPPTAVHAPANS